MKTSLDENIEAFMIYIISLSFNLMQIYLAQKALIALLIVKEVKIQTKYLDFLDIILEKKTLILLKIIDLNQHIIKF